VRAAFEAAGYKIQETKPHGHALERVGSNEVELVYRGRPSPPLNRASITL
jgi:hypothetical protein